MVDDNDIAKQIYGQLIMRVWNDPGFKKRLKENTKEALKEVGLLIPPDMEMEVHLQTPKHIHIIIPENPPELDELAEEEMRKFSGGAVLQHLAHFRINRE